MGSLQMRFPAHAIEIFHRWDEGILALPWQVATGLLKPKKGDRDHLRVVNHKVLRACALLMRKIEEGEAMQEGSAVSLHHVSLLFFGICVIHKIQTTALYDEISDFVTRVGHFVRISAVMEIDNPRSKVTLNEDEHRTPMKMLIDDFAGTPPSDSKKRKRSVPMLSLDLDPFNFDVDLSQMMQRITSARECDITLREEIPVGQQSLALNADELDVLPPVEVLRQDYMNPFEAGQSPRRMSTATTCHLDPLILCTEQPPLPPPIDLPPEEPEFAASRRSKRPRKTRDPAENHAILEEVMRQAFPDSEKPVEKDAARADVTIQVEPPEGVIQPQQSDVEAPRPQIQLDEENPPEHVVVAVEQPTSAARASVAMEIEEDMFTGQILPSVPLAEFREKSPRRLRSQPPESQRPVRSVRPSFDLEPLDESSAAASDSRRRRKSRRHLIVDNETQIGLRSSQDYGSSDLRAPKHHLDAIWIEGTEKYGSWKRLLSNRSSPGQLAVPLKRMFDKRFHEPIAQPSVQFNDFVIPQVLPSQLRPFIDDIQNAELTPDVPNKTTEQQMGESHDTNKDKPAAAQVIDDPEMPVLQPEVPVIFDNQNLPLVEQAAMPILPELDAPETLRHEQSSLNATDAKLQVNISTATHTPLEKSRDAVLGLSAPIIEPGDGSMMMVLSEPELLMPRLEMEVRPELVLEPLQPVEQEMENGDRQKNAKRRKRDSAKKPESVEEAKKKGARKPSTDSSQSQESQSSPFVPVSRRFNLPTPDVVTAILEEGLQDGKDNFYDIFCRQNRKQAAVAFGVLLDMHKKKNISLRRDDQGGDDCFGDPKTLLISRSPV